MIIIIRGEIEEASMLEVLAMEEDSEDNIQMNKLTSPPILLQSFATTAVNLDIQLQNVQNLNSKIENLTNTRTIRHEKMQPSQRQIPKHKTTLLLQLLCV
jgi:hypothetical protein